MACLPAQDGLVAEACESKVNDAQVEGRYRQPHRYFRHRAMFSRGLRARVQQVPILLPAAYWRIPQGRPGAAVASHQLHSTSFADPI
jgi:hypothetical protein